VSSSNSFALIGSQKPLNSLGSKQCVQGWFKVLAILTFINEDLRGGFVCT